MGHPQKLGLNFEVIYSSGIVLTKAPSIVETTDTWQTRVGHPPAGNWAACVDNNIGGSIGWGVGLGATFGAAWGSAGGPGGAALGAGKGVINGVVGGTIRTFYGCYKQAF